MTLNVLTIGAGFFAALHVEAWVRNPDTRLVAIADLDPEKAGKLARNHGIDAAVYSDPSHAIKATKPDIIDIATPPETHLDLIALAHNARPKAIICQKPFCGSLNTARKAVTQTDSLLIVHENFRFQPWYRLLKTEITHNAIGDLYQITFRLRTGDGQGENAYLERQPYFQKMERFLIHETGIHYIDTFRYLMGEPLDVFADLRQLNPAIKGEDAGHVLFGFEDGKRAVFDGNRLADHAANNPRLTMGECLIEGSDGALHLDGFGKVSLRKPGQMRPRQLKTSYNTEAFGGDCVYLFQKHVSDHLLTGSDLETSAKDYLTNMEIEEKIYQSSDARRVLSL